MAFFDYQDAVFKHERGDTDGSDRLAKLEKIEGFFNDKEKNLLVKNGEFERICKARLASLGNAPLRILLLQNPAELQIIQRELWDVADREKVTNIYVKAINSLIKENSDHAYDRQLSQLVEIIAAISDDSQWENLVNQRQVPREEIKSKPLELDCIDELISQKLQTTPAIANEIFSSDVYEYHNLGNCLINVYSSILEPTLEMLLEEHRLPIEKFVKRIAAIAHSKNAPKYFHWKRESINYNTRYASILNVFQQELFHLAKFQAGKPLEEQVVEKFCWIKQQMKILIGKNGDDWVKRFLFVTSVIPSFFWKLATFSLEIAHFKQNKFLCR